MKRRNILTILLIICLSIASANALTWISADQINATEVNTNRLIALDSGAIGTDTPYDKFHIRAGVSGLTSVTGGIDGAIIENSRAAALWVISPNSTTSSIFFGDSESDVSGRVSYNNADDDLSFWTKSGERFTINNAGDIGAGTNNPNFRLVSSDTANQFQVLDSNDDDSTSDNTVFNQNNDEFTITMADTGGDDITIQSDGDVILGQQGNLGIGKTSTNAKLDIEVDDSNFIQKWSRTGASGGDFGFAIDSTNLNLYRTTGANFNIFPDGNGNVVIGGTTSSDSKLEIRNEGSGKNLYLYMPTNAPGQAMQIRADGNTIINLGMNRTRSEGTNWFYRDYDSTATAGPLVFLEQDNAGDNQNVLTIQQDGIGKGTYYDINGNAQGIRMDSSATSEELIVLNAEGINTESVFYAVQNHASSSGDVIEAIQDGTGSIFSLTQNSNNCKINIDTDGTCDAGTALVVDNGVAICAVCS